MLEDLPGHKGENEQSYVLVVFLLLLMARRHGPAKTKSKGIIGTKMSPRRLRCIFYFFFVCAEEVRL